MAVVREDTVKVSFDVDDKPIKQVDDSIDNLVENTQKMAGSSGVGNLTKGFQSLANAAKEFAKTKVDAVKASIDKFKTSLTGGEKGAKGLLNAVKNIAKASLSKVISGVKNLATGLGKALAAAGKLAAKLAGITTKGLMAGLGAGAAGIAALGTSAIKAYAEYEQLVGGVDTLFKDSSKTVQQYANNAYKTAGLSANAYMETVTGFSASLLQSLGGDTQKAAQYADMAVTDMADNANKMGTDMGSIQDAYQGFAKQNYTMLDNLKLGYGGTKEEMQRLLKDAEKISGQKFDISSYADVVQAIHVMQEEMGIAGTTAKEASSTIQGSFNSMKGAWTNFVAGLANPDADLDMLVGNLIDSVVTFGDNVIPKIQVMLPRLVQGLTQLAQSAAKELPGILTTLLPALVDGAIGLMDSLVSLLRDNTQQLSTMATDIIMKLATFLLQSLPQILVVGINLLTTLATGIAQQLPTLMPLAIQAILTVANSLMQNLPTILMAGIQVLLALVQGITQMLPALIPMAVTLILQLAQGLMQNFPTILQAGIQLLLTLALGILDALPQLIAMVPQMFFSFIEALFSINWLDVGLQLITGIFNGVWEGIKSLGGGIVDGIKGLFGGGGKEAGAETVNKLASGIDTTTPVAVSAVSGMNTQVNNTANDGVANLVSTTSTGLEGLTTAYTDSYTTVQTTTTTAMGDIEKTIASTDLYDSGADVMKGLNRGMESQIPALEATARKAAQTIRNATNTALDIHSPSRVMFESGENAGLGQIGGLRSTIPEMQIAAREVSNASIPYDTYSPDSGSTYYNGGNSEYTTISPQFNLTISGTQDDRAMARKVKRYVAEAIQDTFESLERKSYRVREA